MREKWFRWFSFTRAVFWFALLVPSYFFGWIYSVAFVAICSIYANGASDFAAWRADSNKEILNRLDRIEKMVKQITKEETQG